MTRFFGIAAIAGAVVFILVLLVGADGFIGSPFVSEVDLSFPQYAVRGPDESVYVVDSSMRRVSRIGLDGTHEFSIDGGSRDEGSFFYVDDIAVDSDGALYVLNWVLDAGGMFMQREEILRYEADGAFDGIVYQRTYDQAESTRIQRGELIGLEAQGETIRFFEIREDFLAGYELTPPRFVPRRRGSVALEDAFQRIADISWDGESDMLLSTKEGRIERRSSTGDRDVLFDATDSDWTGRRIVPWELGRDGEGRVSFVDLEGRRVVSLERGEADPDRLSTRISRERIESAGFSAEDTIYYRLSVGPDGSLVTTDDYSVIIEQGDGIEHVLTGARLSTGTRVLRWLWWIALVLSCALLVFGITYTYIHLFRRRISMIAKQLLVIVPLLLLSIGLISGFIIRENLDRLTEAHVNRISAMAQTIGLGGRGDLFEEIEDQSDFWSDEYREIRRYFRAGLNTNRDEWNKDVYFALYRVENDQLYGFMYQNDRIGMYYPFTWFDDPNSVYRDAYNERVASELVTDVSGDWLYAVAPVYDSAGSVAGLVEIGTDLYSFQLENRALYIRTVSVVAGITAIIVLVLGFSTYLLLKAIRILRRGAAAIAEGEWDTHVDIRSNDEVFDLANTFNEMSSSIQNYMRRIEELNVSYRRFVPEQFITYLGKESVTAASLGDQVDKEMTVLFSDIRSFTELSEQMSPKENFDFLNDYLRRVGPFIRSRNGFIDKYIGDAIMALFPREADDAVQAAVDIKHTLREFNKSEIGRGQGPIDIGIGIHTGRLMLGILGETERLQGTVISDNVNVAARLETMTKQMGASVLISGESFDRLASAERYLYRYIGRARVKGRAQSLRIYEILDGEPQERRDSKVRTRGALESALEFYVAGDLKRAMRGFEQVLREAPHDRVAALYRRACYTYLRTGMPEEWHGALILASK